MDGRGSQFPSVFKKDDPKLTRKRKLLSYYEEEEAAVEFATKVEEHYNHFFIKRLKQLSTVFVVYLKKKDLTETLQALEILLLKALCEEDFSSEPQKMSQNLKSY